MVGDIEALAWYAQTNPDIWNLTVGSKIIHKDNSIGECTIIRIDKKKYLRLRSNSDGKGLDFLLSNIPDFFNEILFPEHNLELKEILTKAKKEKLDEEEKERAKKERERKILKLRTKYNIPNFKNAHLLNWADQIIEKVEAGLILIKHEEKKMVRYGMLNTLALYCENKIKNDPWYIPKAGSYWRLAGYPEHTLNITNINISNANLMARILTTRGGAFRDLDEHNKAEDCAIKAIKYDDKGCCPYNLLGAIYIDLDLLDEGREYFDIAKTKKGYKPEGQACMLNEILKKYKKNRDKQRRIEEYFKDYLFGNQLEMPGFDDIPF